MQANPRAGLGGYVREHLSGLWVLILGLLTSLTVYWAAWHWETQGRLWSFHQAAMVAAHALQGDVRTLAASPEAFPPTMPTRTRLIALAREALGQLPARDMRLAVVDPVDDGNPTLEPAGWLPVNPPGQGAAPDPEAFARHPLRHDAHLALGGHALAVRLIPAPGFHAPADWPQALLGLGLGLSVVLAILAQHRRRVDRALRDSQTLLAMIMRHSPVYLYVKEVAPGASRTLYASDNYERMLGIPTREMIGKTMEALFPADLAAAMTADDWAVVTENRVLAREETLDGRHYSSFKVPISHGGKKLLVGYSLDVTEQRQAELGLRASQAYIRAVLDALHDVVFVHDAVSGRVLDVNQAVCDRYGHAREDILARGAGEFGLGREPYTCRAAREWLRKAREEGPQTFEWISRNSAGEPFWLEMAARFLVIGDQERFIVTGRDISERKQAELELRRFQQVVETSGEKLLFIDRELRYQVVNPAYARLFNARPADLQGRRLADLLEPDVHARLLPHLEAALAGEPQYFNQRITYPNGKSYALEAEYQPFRAEGEVLGIVVSLHDVTELQAAQGALEVALKEAKRLARVRSEFLANMSHEIRTPLNAVLGLAQVGLRESGGRKLRDSFRRILDAGQHLLGVINDILDFSKIEAGQLTLERGEARLGAIIDGALDLIAAQAYAKGLEVRVMESPDLPERCQGDALRLSQVLVNLLSNAVKFTARGQVTLSASRDGEWLLFQVADSGIGMTPDQLTRLFTPFQQADGSTTRRFGGTGLGLTICRRLVELMGGEIQVDSEPDQGSRFRVRLPLVAPGPPLGALPGRVALVGLDEGEATGLASDLAAWGIETPWRAADCPPPDIPLDLILATPRVLCPARVRVAHRIGQTVAVAVTPSLQTPVEALSDTLHELRRPLRARHLRALLQSPGVAHQEPTASGPRLAGLHLLAAEDNEVNRLVLEEMLTGEGARLTCLENGQRLLEHLDQVGDGAYSLLLTDIQMPELDGYATARRCRERYPGLPIVGLTAHALAEERERCLAVGMVAHVAKPVDLERLVGVILEHARHLPAVAAPEVPPVAPTPPPAVPSGHGALIDWAGLEARYPGKTAFVERLLAGMRRASASIPGQLRAAAEAHDLAQVAFLAHGLKGSSGNLMAWRLHERAKATERAAREGGPDVVALAEGLADELEALLAELAQPPATAPQEPRDQL